MSAYARYLYALLALYSLRTLYAVEPEERSLARYIYMRISSHGKREQRARRARFFAHYARAREQQLRAVCFCCCTPGIRILSLVLARCYIRAFASCALFISPHSARAGRWCARSAFSCFADYFPSIAGFVVAATFFCIGGGQRGNDRVVKCDGYCWGGGGFGISCERLRECFMFTRPASHDINLKKGDKSRYTWDFFVYLLVNYWPVCGLRHV